MRERPDRSYPSSSILIKLLPRVAGTLLFAVVCELNVLELSAPLQVFDHILVHQPSHVCRLFGIADGVAVLGIDHEIELLS